MIRRALTFLWENLTLIIAGVVVLGFTLWAMYG